MAVILPGPLAADVRGKLGDIVFTRGQGGAAVRTIGSWVQPDTAAQLATREALAALAVAWSSALSEDQRHRWRTYARANPRPNRWGDLTITNGYCAFIRHNFHAYLATLEIQFPSCPTAPPIHPPDVQISIKRTTYVKLSGDCTPDATGDYHAAGQYEGKPYYLRTDNAFDIWTFPDSTQQMLTTRPRRLDLPRFYKYGDYTGTWDPWNNATGNPTSTLHPTTGIASINLPPTNYTNPHPDLTLYIYSGIPLAAGRQYYSGPWRHLVTISPPDAATPQVIDIPWTWPVHATEPPYTWPLDGTGHTRAYAVAQYAASGAMSTAHVLRPKMVPA